MHSQVDSHYKLGDDATKFLHTNFPSLKTLFVRNLEQVSQMSYVRNLKQVSQMSYELQ